MKKLLSTLSFLMVLTQTLPAADAKLSVTGNSSVFKLADQLTLVLGVESYDKESKAAVKANAGKMKLVIEALKNIGVTEHEIQTHDFTVIPQTSPSPQNPPPDWQPAIVGYRVRNTLNIRTTKLESAGAMIDAVSKAGGNYIQSITFSLQEEDLAKAEAIGKAFKQADAYAHALAKEAGVRTGEIIELSIGHSYVGAVAFKAERLNSVEETPISPREVEVTASVSVVFSIENQR